MAVPAIGVGQLIANDMLTDASYALFEPVVSTMFPAGGVGIGSHTVTAWDASMYVGAQLVVGIFQQNLEVVTITAVNPGVSFTAVFENEHIAQEQIVGATFPVQQSAGDYFFTQAEMLQYLSTALNDFLTRCPLVYTVSTAVVVGPTQQNAPLPGDCMYPVRVAAFGNSLRETSQSYLDSYNFQWQSQGMNTPYTYFRDKIGLGNIGIWPKAGNMTTLEVTYAQRSPQAIGLGDGFLLPDPFMPYIKARMLEFIYSKDGAQASPGMARFWNQRYEAGLKISAALLEAITSPDLQ